MKYVAIVALMLSFGVAHMHAQGVSQIVLSCSTPPPESHTAKYKLSSSVRL